jgi:CubicO group peptidase (beta-lactamase class C family)
MAQPGERCLYHVSGDVLGVLIARVSGQSLGTFMRERIFDPLGMKDTAFHVPSEKIGRLPTWYGFNHQTKTLELYDDAANRVWLPEPRFESGGGGLVSTIDDYFAFSLMMLNKGRYGSEKILSRERRESVHYVGLFDDCPEAVQPLCECLSGAQVVALVRLRS